MNDFWMLAGVGAMFFLAFAGMGIFAWGCSFHKPRTRTTVTIPKDTWTTRTTASKGKDD